MQLNCYMMSLCITVIKSILISCSGCDVIHALPEYLQVPALRCKRRYCGIKFIRNDKVAAKNHGAGASRGRHGANPRARQTTLYTRGGERLSHKDFLL